MQKIKQIRKIYAQEVFQRAGIKSKRVLEAFAKVPKEKFFGPGPWKMIQLKDNSYQTSDDNPEYLYQDTLIVLDQKKKLNSGRPSWLAMVFAAANPLPGETVVHIGAGVGYYTAILAELVTSKGEVIAVEIDDQLVLKLKENLKDYTNISVIHADGSIFPVPPCNVLLINAGATYLQKQWVTCLCQAGRLLVPLTIADSSSGLLLRVTRIASKYRAEFLHGVSIYPCLGMQSDQESKLLSEAILKHGRKFSGQLRFDPENADSSCWLQSKDYWFSTTAV